MLPPNDTHPPLPWFVLIFSMPRLAPTWVAGFPADKCTHHRRRNQTPPLPIFQHIAGMAARSLKCAKPKRIARHFKDGVQFGVRRDVERG
jgi:hypothetical protein